MLVPHRLIPESMIGGIRAKSEAHSQIRSGYKMGNADSQFEMETSVPQEGGQATKAASKMKDPKHRDWLQDHENRLQALEQSDLEERLEDRWSESWTKLTE